MADLLKILQDRNVQGAIEAIAIMILDLQKAVDTLAQSKASSDATTTKEG